METEKCKQCSMLIWVLVAALLYQCLVVPVTAITFEDQKNYYSPAPHARSPHRGSHRSPSHGTTPSHGSGTPSHGSGTPSHGSYPTPSTPNCGTPPQVTTPPCGGCGNTPQVPTPTPTTPSNPPSGGGGSYNPSPPYVGGPPPTPIIANPPPTPISVPTPPFVPDPNSPFTCYYWRTHPGIIWGLFGWWGTLGSAFGVTSLPGLGVSTSLQQALSNTRTDGYGTLYREGTASLLNSMVNNRFSLTTRQVRESFIAALGSNKAAAAQGHLFKLANEGRLRP